MCSIVGGKQTTNMRMLKKRKVTTRFSAEIDATAKADFDAAVEEAAHAGYEVDPAAIVESTLTRAARTIRAAVADVGKAAAGAEEARVDG